MKLGITNKDARGTPISTRKLIGLSFLALLDLVIDYRGQNVGCFAYVSGAGHEINAEGFIRSGMVFDVLSLLEPVSGGRIKSGVLAQCH